MSKHKKVYRNINRSQQNSRAVPLKVHKHEIFLNTFLQKPNPYGPKGL